MIVAQGKQTDITKLKTYIYRLNFRCLAGDIEEADECFQKQVQLTFADKKPGWMCPAISREIVNPPMYPEGVPE